MKFSQAFIRFLIIVAIGWVGVFALPMTWFVNTYLPFSFFLLMGLVTFGICGLGWPFAAPMGILWKPDNRVIPGVLMVAVWIGMAFVLSAVQQYVWPRVPLAAGPFFGIIIFMVTLWYTFDGVGPHPFKQPWLNWLFATVVIYVLSGVLFKFFVNFNGTPGAGAPFDPQGIFPGPYWFGLCVWIIVWIQVFGNSMCLQGWPFYKLGQPLHPILLTVAVIVLGYGCWEGTMAMGISPTFSFGAIAASAIGWSLMHAVAFEMTPFAKYIQPKRGLFNFILEEVILVAVWIVALRILLVPINAKLVATGMPFGIDHMSAWFTLHVVAIILLIHQLFFMRTPLSIPAPPLGPEEVPPVSMEEPAEKEMVNA
ncbi:hypothetical protein DSCO28_65450 [Desulfosarcina ovata subsp. sediminis]|uniref:Uncharacterized protein n=1 Tax=Desulfosarcina ovata subsp. sediminis TaxID=885957 RepID=A0A5K8A0C2_9BACT|nr:hypothetical protein [Desulfosarcina ovata]BBO85979.1 hypothetical protein DSCO28_65450 [Desulfosarcina ovata subsp. sediminis]